jgi:hypothetical protein
VAANGIDWVQLFDGQFLSCHFAGSFEGMNCLDIVPTTIDGTVITNTQALPHGYIMTQEFVVDISTV